MPFKELSSYRDWRQGKGYLARKEIELRSRHGIDATEFGQMILDQNGVCALCNLPLGLKFCIDHNHATGKIRGLLHQNCNHLLGIFETFYGIDKIVNYLRV